MNAAAADSSRRGLLDQSKMGSWRQSQRRFLESVAQERGHEFWRGPVRGAAGG